MSGGRRWPRRPKPTCRRRFSRPPASEPVRRGRAPRRNPAASAPRGPPPVWPGPEKPMESIRLQAQPLRRKSRGTQAMAMKDVRGIRWAFFLQPLIRGAWFPRIPEVQAALGLKRLPRVLERGRAERQRSGCGRGRGAPGAGKRNRGSLRAAWAIWASAMSPWRNPSASPWARVMVPAKSSRWPPGGSVSVGPVASLARPSGAGSRLKGAGAVGNRRRCSAAMRAISGFSPGDAG